MTDQVTPAAGHNSKAQLLGFVDRLVRLQEEKKTFAEDIRELKKEAKDLGFDPKEVDALAKLRIKGKEESKLALEAYERRLETLGWLN